jgi:FAD/FMN-containing dehydrogenase
MRRFFPALGLFALLVCVSVSAAATLTHNAGSVMERLRAASEQVKEDGAWDSAGGCFTEARFQWDRKRHFYAFAVNQTRNSEIAVQWKRAETALREKERETFLLENAALAAMLKQLIHDFEIKWYNIL